MSEFTKRVLMPVSIPLAAMLFIAIVAFALSRVLLAVPEAGSTTLAFLLAGGVLAGASVVAITGSKLKASQRLVLGIAGLATLGAGAASASLGVREIEAHLTAYAVGAKDIAYTVDSLTVPPDVDIAIAFSNGDANVPHDIDIFADDSFTPPPLFDGETFNGSATVTYIVPALAVGDYPFRCSIHPQMLGTLHVEEGAAEGAAH